MQIPFGRPRRILAFECSESGNNEGITRRVNILISFLGECLTRLPIVLQLSSPTRQRSPNAPRRWPSLRDKTQRALSFHCCMWRTRPSVSVSCRSLPKDDCSRPWRSPNRIADQMCGPCEPERSATAVHTCPCRKFNRAGS